MDLVGAGYDDFSAAQRSAVEAGGIRVRHSSRKISCKPFTTASSIVLRPPRAPVWPM